MNIPKQDGVLPRLTLSSTLVDGSFELFCLCSFATRCRYCTLIVDYCGGFRGRNRRSIGILHSWFCSTPRNLVCPDKQKFTYGAPQGWQGIVICYYHCNLQSDTAGCLPIDHPPAYILHSWFCLTTLNFVCPGKQKFTYGELWFQPVALFGAELLT